jgi:hypothetical protein
MWVQQADQEILGFRVHVGRGGLKPSFLHGQAFLLRPLRHRQTAFALTEIALDKTPAKRGARLLA